MANYLLDEESLKIIQELVDWKKNIHGPGVRNGWDGMSINPPVSRGGGVETRRHKPILAKVTAYTQDGANFRWIYTGKRVKKTSAGYGGWETQGDELTIYNAVEDMNGSTGQYGSGDQQTWINDANGIDGDGTFAVRPIPVGALIYVARFNFDGTDEWWTTFENGTFGTCGGVT